MSRIATTFQRLKTEGRRAFIPYLTAGDPNLETTADLLGALADGGADIIELGVPFSDPMADGPVIQRASERALRSSIGVADVLSVASAFRRRYEVPLVLFTYFNPLLQYCQTSCGAALKRVGIDGVLVTDLIPEEAGAFIEDMRSSEVDTIFLVAPTSTDARIRLISESAAGFIYVIARTGVTGIREVVGTEVRTIVERIRRQSTLPVAVGFGISQPEHVREVWSYADGAVVGSRIVQEIEANLDRDDLVQRVKELAQLLSRTEPVRLETR